MKYYAIIFTKFGSTDTKYIMHEIIEAGSAKAAQDAVRDEHAGKEIHFLRTFESSAPIIRTPIY